MVVDQYDADQLTPSRRLVPPATAGISLALTAQRPLSGTAAGRSFELAPDLPAKRRLEALYRRMVLAQVIQGESNDVRGRTA